jgi:hypothetical protein
MSLSSNSDYLELRKHIRTADRLDALLRVWAFSNFFADNNFPISKYVSVPETLRRDGLASALFSPWEAFELAREIIIHSETRSGNLVASRWEYWLRAIILSRKVEQSVDELQITPGNILIAINRLMRRQTPWQSRRNENADFYRALLIYGEKTLSDLVLSRFQLHVEKLFFLSYLFYMHFLDNPILDEAKLQIDFATPEEVNSYLSLYSSRLDNLASELAAETKKANSYCYRYTALQRRPIIRVRHSGKNLLMCPVPSLIPRRLYSGIYYELIGVEGAFSNLYGNAFHSLVANYSKYTLTRFVVYDEDIYRKGKSELRTCDLILHDSGNDVVFVECKAKRITERARSAVDLGGDLSADLEIIADAGAQLIKSIEDFRDNHYPQIKFNPAERLHCIVVVPEDLFITGPTIRNELITHVASNLETKLRSPTNPPVSPSHVEFISIREYEKFVTVIERVGAKAVFDKRRLHQYKDWGFSNFLNDAFADDAVSDLQFYIDASDKAKNSLAAI